MLNLGVKKLLQKVEQNSTFYNNLSQPATSELLQERFDLDSLTVKRATRTFNSISIYLYTIKYVAELM